MKSVRHFFEQQADAYRSLYEDMSRTHRSAATAIEQRCSGRTICVGGLWPGADPLSLPTDLTIVDLTPKMLSLWKDYGAKAVCSDARRLPMESHSVDTIIYPMVLHHVCEGTAKSARQGVRDVFREANRVLAPGGRLLIFDWSVSSWVYAIELALSRATSGLLALSGIPLVIMHSACFYRDVLAAAGFVDIEQVAINQEHGESFALVRPIIGLSWFVVPRFAYPVSQLFLEARRNANDMTTAERSGS